MSAVKFFPNTSWLSASADDFGGPLFSKSSEARLGAASEEKNTSVAISVLAQQEPRNRPPQTF